MKYVLAILCLLFNIAVAEAAPAYVQGALAPDPGCCPTGTTWTITLSANVTSGDAVALVFNGGNNPALSSITDDKSNSYTVLDSINDTANTNASYSTIAYNITNAPHIFTATYPTAVCCVSGVADEYSGVSSTDQHVAHAQDTSPSGTDSVVSTNVTTTVNGDLIWGQTQDITGLAGVSYAAGTGYTLREHRADTATVLTAISSEDQIQSTAGSIQATFTPTGTGNCATYLIAAKASGASSTVQPSLTLTGVGP